MGNLIKAPAGNGAMAERPVTGEMISLDELAAQMRMYSDGARGDYVHMMMNLLQFGRVMLEAKGRVRHGEWQSWVEMNSGFSLRTAETYMQAYQEFGLNPDIARLGKSKVVQMLPVPEDVRTKVLENYDVESMSAREFKAVLKAETEKAAAEARAEAWAEAGERLTEERKKAETEKAEEIEKERQIRLDEIEKARGDGQARAEKAAKEQILQLEKALEDERIRAEKAIEDERNASRTAAVPPEMVEAMEEKDLKLMEQRKEIERLGDQIAEMMESMKGAGDRETQVKISELETRLERMTEKLENSTRKYAELKEEYLNLQSTIQKGDAERAPADELTAEVFSGAVRSFIGAVARMPHMAGTFAGMSQEERRTFDDLLKTVEGWSRGARQALDTVAEGGVIV